MVLRFFILFSLVLMGVTAYFIVIQQPPTVQLPPMAAEVTRFQQEGLLPTGELEENDEAEHGIFDVPPMDEMMLEQAMQGMEGMGNMPGMDMDGESGSMNMPQGSGNTMNMGAGDGSMPMAEGSGATMKMGDGSAPMAMGEDSMRKTEDSGAPMQMGDEAASMEMGDGSGTNMKMEMQGGSMTMADGSGVPMQMEAGSAPMAMQEMTMDCKGEDGLLFCPADAKADREITLSMREWEFDQMQIEVKAGERIRFTVRNDGKTLHEFMFMTMPLMQAVAYRAKRADWSLLEHEALFEKSLLLPGQDLTFVVEVQETGSWMFMCMLPYHMQMGMMGQMATPGAAMDMKM